MRTKLTVLIILISVSTLIAQEYRIISDKEVRDTAQAQLGVWLEKLEGGLYKNFGFNNLEELNRVEIGTPYEMVFLSNDFVSDSVFINGKNYFTKENRSWDVPLLVDSEMRCFLSVYYRNDTLKAIGIGGSSAAKEREVCMKKYAIPTEGKKYILVPEVLYLCEFIMHFDEEKDNYTLYPVFDKCASEVSYNKHNSLEDFFYSYKNNEYNSVRGISIDQFSFKIFPNPLISIATFKVFIPLSTKDATIHIYDNKGMKLFQEKLNQRGELEKKLPQDIFPESGIYIFKINMDNKAISKKIIVAK
jgi:hypothetical protein